MASDAQPDAHSGREKETEMDKQRTPRTAVVTFRCSGVAPRSKAFPEISDIAPRPNSRSGGDQPPATAVPI